MARVLIAGCGYVGEATADLFHQRGWEVEGWTASADSAMQLADKPYAVRSVDIANATAISEECASANSEEFDVVVECVSSRGGEAEQYRGIYFEGARNLICAFPQAKLLFTSSTSVYAQEGGESVDESSPAEPRHERGKILRETEELVLAHGGIVARLGGIHGPGRSFFLTRFLEGEAGIDPNDRRLINQAHRDDIAAALFLLAERRQSGIFNVVGDEAITASEAYEWLSEMLRRPLPPIIKLPERRKRGQGNKRVSNKKLRALGWEPRYPNFRVAMTESIFPSLGF